MFLCCTRVSLNGYIIFWNCTVRMTYRSLTRQWFLCGPARWGCSSSVIQPVVLCCCGKYSSWLVSLQKLLFYLTLYLSLSNTHRKKLLFLSACTIDFTNFVVPPTISSKVSFRYDLTKHESSCWYSQKLLFKQLVVAKTSGQGNMVE